MKQKSIPLKASKKHRRLRRDESIGTPLDPPPFWLDSILYGGTHCGDVPGEGECDEAVGSNVSQERRHSALPNTSSPLIHCCG